MRCFLAASLLAISTLVQAQFGPSGVRLSTHLENAAQDLADNPDGLGLVWTTPEERQRQQGVHQQLRLQLEQLQAAETLSEASYRAMQRLLQDMPPIMIRQIVIPTTAILVSLWKRTGTKCFWNLGRNHSSLRAGGFLHLTQQPIRSARSF